MVTDNSIPFFLDYFMNVFIYTIMTERYDHDWKWFYAQFILFIITSHKLEKTQTLNSNSTIYGNGTNPRSQAKVHLFQQVMIVKCSATFHPQPFLLCMSLFVCLFLACAVSAMLCEVVASGVSSRAKSGSVDGEKVKGDMDFDVVLCQLELMERALQLCHLLPPGFMPVSLNSYHTSHTQPCVSLSGCLIGLNSHSSCSATPIFGRERGQIFVCTFPRLVSVWWNLRAA